MGHRGGRGLLARPNNFSRRPNMTDLYIDWSSCADRLGCRIIQGVFVMLMCINIVRIYTTLQMVYDEIKNICDTTGSRLRFFTPWLLMTRKNKDEAWKTNNRWDRGYTSVAYDVHQQGGRSIWFSHLDDDNDDTNAFSDWYRFGK